MQKYGKIRKLPRLPTKKIAEKNLYDDILLYRLRKFHSYSPFFAPPRWNEVLPFSIPFDGV